MAGWKPVGIPSIVSRAQGNIILALDDDVPPTRVLVDNLEKAKGEILPVNKESEYFLGIVDQDVSVLGHESVDASQKDVCLAACTMASRISKDAR